MISTAYRLPFRFSYCEKVFSSGQHIQIVLRSDGPEGLAALASVTGTFAALARSGALCGRDLPPWKAAFTGILATASQPHEVRYLVDHAFLSDEALVVLAHLLLATRRESRVSSAEVSATDGRTTLLAQNAGAESTYPSLFRSLPFSVTNLGPESGSYTIRIELETALGVGGEEWLNAALASWMRGVLAGAYGLAPLPPEESYVETVDEGVTTFDNMVEWAVFKLRADGSSIDGILNMLGAFHMQCQKIRGVEIE